MVNEVVYCPRLFALEYLHGEWADTADTEDGRRVHRNVDKESEASLPDPEEDEERPVVRRSVMLGDPDLGVIGRLDLVEAEGNRAVPVDYKRGRAPDIPHNAWPPERVQVCCQGLLLRAHGYECDHGVLYFAGSRRRVEVRFDDELIEQTHAAIAEARRIVEAGTLPPPLVDSPRCKGCSLVGICLPDEHNLLAGRTERVRPLVPPRDDALPLYVRLQGGSLGKKGDEIVIRERREEIGRVRIEDTSRVAILGNVSVTTPLLQTLARRDIPVSFHTSGGWHVGTFVPNWGHNVQTRIAQHRAAADPERALALARAFIESKIRNGRVILRRNGEPGADRLQRLKELADEARDAESLDSLRGVEGVAARVYFEALPTMIRTELRDRFEFSGRNRRPPKDPVNALLSFAYACLARELTVTCMSIGMDAYVGFLHQPRPGRAALALDLMEELRPVVADSVVIGAINNGEVQPDDFIERHTGVALTDAGRRRFIQAFERRMDTLATHPVLGTRLSMRRILEVQARLLGKVVLGELPTYPQYRIR
ncbi:MAG: CRISPR-associated endonuclease Cas1 [Deltaproteobacteria bacterium]|nr:MAG: CRISPR-associated endonuclease Cas1 [Deltaproteobacteria bacterium]